MTSVSIRRKEPEQKAAGSSWQVTLSLCESGACQSLQPYKVTSITVWFRVTEGKRRIRRGERAPERGSRAGPGQSRRGGIKGGGERGRASFGAFPPEGREEERGCSPDRSEDVLFCFRSALPLPAGSNITLGTKGSASSAADVSRPYRWNGTIMDRQTRRGRCFKRAVGSRAIVCPR